MSNDIVNDGDDTFHLKFPSINFVALTKWGIFGSKSAEEQGT